ncbi:hypothetical protein BCR36DRAFT_371011 [Piromyces finnis]|uniref:RSE1/DDB1/CPSF1 second beta-propeller domain-containing protein n=1 Tax=Piromyces finnis TaxID=1754191 RepID=A0A1Y1V752_9FUNG|nr:hypothetical protein BCR36DRAFT_371011 [Piromyces finnis]|eukprot:ORX48945.1 hypothetical protein BCR36DRAFT_371011 [Piromyces finnis]
MNKLLKRQKDLSNFIDFDIVDYVIFDHPPMTEYELYIRNFGNSNTVQVAVQSNEELTSREQQTEDWNIQDKYVQATSQYLTDCGTGEPNLPWLKKDVDYFTSSKLSKENQLKSVNMKTLKSFLKRTSNLMEKILESDAKSYIENKEGFTTSNNTLFAEGYIALKKLKIVEGRKPLHIDYSPNSSKILFIHWSSVEDNNIKLDANIAKFKTNDMITIFNYNNDLLPIKILLCECQLTCCKYCGTSEQYIIAGNTNGNLCLWDLDSYDKQIVQKEENITRSYYIYFPCYSTIGSFNEKISHENPIQNIIILNEVSDVDDNYFSKGNNYGSSEEINETTEIVENNGQSFQIMSIDQSGLAKIWTAIKITEDSSINLFEYDFGLNYNSKIRLISGNSIKIGKKQWDNDNLSVNNSCLLSNGRIIISTNFGEIYQESRFGEACYPKQYTINESFTYQLDLDDTIITKEEEEESRKSLSNYHKLSSTHCHSCLLKITAFCCSPFNPDLFLVGYDNSIVALYSSLYSNSLYEWKVNNSSLKKTDDICQICWSMDRPFVFFILCKSNILYIFDLLESEIDPLYTCLLTCETTAKEESSKLSITSIAVSKSESKEYTCSILTVGWSNGSIILYKLREDLTEMVIDEEEKFNEQFKNIESI